MRILVLSNLYPPNVVGGYERLCFEVTSELVARGHDVQVLTSGFGGGDADYPGQTIHRTLELFTGETIYDSFPGDEKARRAITDRNLEEFRRVLTESDADVVFSWNLFFLDPSFLPELERVRVPVVVMLTDNWLINMTNPGYMSGFFDRFVFGPHDFGSAARRPDGARPSWRRRLEPTRVARFVRRRIGRLIRGSAQRIDTPAPPAAPLQLEAIFGSAFMQELHADAGLSFRRAAVIHNGVDQTYTGSSPASPRNRFVDPDEIRLLFAGRLVDLKGAHTAVEALPVLERLYPDLPPVRLTIVGDVQDARYRARLDAVVVSAGERARIDFQPPVGANELFELFQAHDIYLFPSLYEPFSLTLIHALASGIPTIASRAGGNVEIVDDGRTGLTFEKGDPDDLARAIARFVREPALREQVSRAGREIASHFRFERMVDSMEKVLERAR